jgi:integrase/recombinase XerD
MNKRANLLKHVRGGSGWRYYPVVWLQNGSVRPNYVLVNGKAEHHQEGFYSIEWYEHGRRRRQAVGKEASAAHVALERHLHYLQGLVLGLQVRQEAKEPKEPKKSLGDACGEFLDLYRPSTGKKLKTYQAYRMALEHFQESCPKRHLGDIDRRDLQRFTAFLIGKKEHDPRTAHNKLAIVAQFLKANNISGLLKKGDWPSYVEREPEVYEPEELDRLFAACDLRNRVLFEFFLMTGMRDAEVRHTCWSDISPRQFVRVKSKPEWQFTPKNWEEREVPIPDKLMASLNEYRQMIGTGWQLLFPVPSGQPDRHFLRTLKHIAWTAGLNCGFCKTDRGLCRQGPTCERWFLHKFRATYATMQLQGNVDLRTLQALLGHKDLASTMRYLKPARNERVLQQVNNIFGGCSNG